ncbi:GNAT family N-acetyltransferase [bacterium]|nr:GNAT family N-acetyltransferase [bacterium]
MDIRNSITVLKPNHSQEVSVLHADLIPGLLQELGYPMIHLFYETALKSEHNFGFVDFRENKIAGFVFGTTAISTLYKDVALRRAFPIVYQMFRLIFKKPQKIGLLLKVIFYRTYRHQTGCESELVFLAVNPPYQKLGIGKKLMTHFHDYLIQKGISRYEASVEIENESTQKFNEKLGMQLEYVYTEFGIKRLRYSFDLSTCQNHSR